LIATYPSRARRAAHRRTGRSSDCSGILVTHSRLSPAPLCGPDKG
jgi:hypothetical protein